jgi:hypothetical protein
LPILIRDELYALDTDCTVFDRGILEAVTKGVAIKTEHSHNELFKDKTIVDITGIQDGHQNN